MTPSPVHAPLRMLAVLVFCYFISQFYRSSIGVLGPDLMRDVGLTAAALGDLGGSFFLAFALAQVPLGLLFDRFGPRRVVTVVICSAVVGSLLFALAPSPATLLIGRVMMGIGCAPLYMGALLVISRWLPADRFASMAGLVLALGGLGGLAATTPLAVVNELFGWRPAFFAMTAVTALTSLAVWLVVRDAPPGHAYYRREVEGMRATFGGLIDVLRIRQLYFILPINAVAYASLLAVLALWGAPYLKDVHGLGDVARGNVLMVTTVCWMVGSFVYGRLDVVFDTRKWVVVSGVALTALMFCILAFVPRLGFWQIAVLMAVLGVGGAANVVILAHVRALFPERLIGRGLTVTNLFGFGGAALLQMICGRIVGAFPAVGEAAPPIAYTAMFLFLAGVLVAATLVYLRVADIRPSVEVAAQQAAQGSPAFSPSIR